MITESCNACGEWTPGVVRGTVTDTSGGSGVQFCTQCARNILQNADLLAADVCVCCLRRGPARRAEGVHLKGVVGSICDQCRREVCFGDTEPFGEIPAVGGPRQISPDETVCEVES